MDWKSAVGIPLTVVGGAAVAGGVGLAIAGALNTGKTPDPNQGPFLFIVGSLIGSLGGLTALGGGALISSDLNDGE